MDFCDIRHTSEASGRVIASLREQLLHLDGTVGGELDKGLETSCAESPGIVIESLRGQLFHLDDTADGELDKGLGTPEGFLGRLLKKMMSS